MIKNLCDELKTLKERIAQQSEQIKKLQQAVDAQQKLLDEAVSAAETVRAQPQTQAPAMVNASTAGSAPVTLEPAVDRRPRGLVFGRGGQNLQARNPSPLGITIGNTTFTPLGFVDFTWFGRSTNVGSGIGTNFGGIPYNNSTGGHISENNFSTQNSRIGFRVDSTVAGAKVLGYFEADFLGNQPANVFVTSNADTFRMRNVFVDVQKGKWEILGGQDWSMFTPNRKGLSPSRATSSIHKTWTPITRPVLSGHGSANSASCSSKQGLERRLVDWESAAVHRRFGRLERRSHHLAGGNQHRGDGFAV